MEISKEGFGKAVEALEDSTSIGALGDGSTAASGQGVEFRGWVSSQLRHLKIVDCILSQITFQRLETSH